MLKISFHPAFFMYAAVLTLQGKYEYLICTVAAALLHEAGHAAAAYNRGYILNKIVIMPYGAVLYGGENISKNDAFFIGCAGPLTNIIISAFITALWWIAPSAYPFTEAFRNVNVALALFNLLPVYPLDGGRMVLSVCRNSNKALKALRIAGAALSFVMLAGFIATAFFEINYSLGVLSVMMFLSSTGGTEKESYRHIAANAPYLKDREHPIVHKILYVNHNLKLIELLKQIKSDQIVKFVITGDDDKPLKTLSEEDLGGLCLKFNLRSLLRDAIKE